MPTYKLPNYVLPAQIRLAWAGFSQKRGGLEYLGDKRATPLRLLLFSIFTLRQPDLVTSLIAHSSIPNDEIKIRPPRQNPANPAFGSHDRHGHPQAHVCSPATLETTTANEN